MYHPITWATTKGDVSGKRLLGAMEETIVAGTEGGGGKRLCQTWVSYLRKGSAERGPPRIHTHQQVDTNHTKGINSDSTLAREARAMPNRGRTAHHLCRKALPFPLAIPSFLNYIGSRTKGGWEREGERHQTMPSSPR